jgi:hypothetical protein
VPDAPAAAPQVTHVDTVAVAAEDPSHDQPWAELGLNPDE